MARALGGLEAGFVVQRGPRPQPKKDFTTEVTEKRYGQRLWVNKQRTVPLYSLVARAEVLFSVVSVRSVVSFFFAPRDEVGA
jgi:hypothetical protein